ncbi:hypothetical protein C8J56DRAFT_910064 [Mycena floridula]|nr:hypothetical protein C8J56DRAFT_910064 [Mycena floridula]
MPSLMLFKSIPLAGCMAKEWYRTKLGPDLDERKRKPRSASNYILGSTSLPAAFPRQSPRPVVLLNVPVSS